MPDSYIVITKTGQVVKRTGTSPSTVKDVPVKSYEVVTSSGSKVKRSVTGGNVIDVPVNTPAKPNKNRFSSFEVTTASGDVIQRTTQVKGDVVTTTELNKSEQQRKNMGAVFSVMEEASNVSYLGKKTNDISVPIIKTGKEEPKTEEKPGLVQSIKTGLDMGTMLSLNAATTIYKKVKPDIDLFVGQKIIKPSFNYITKLEKNAGMQPSFAPLDKEFKQKTFKENERVFGTTIAKTFNVTSSFGEELRIKTRKRLETSPTSVAEELAVGYGIGKIFVFLEGVGLVRNVGGKIISAGGISTRLVGSLGLGDYIGSASAEVITSKNKIDTATTIAVRDTPLFAGMGFGATSKPKRPLGDSVLFQKPIETDITIGKIQGGKKEYFKPLTETNKISLIESGNVPRSTVKEIWGEKGLKIYKKAELEFAKRVAPPTEKGLYTGKSMISAKQNKPFEEFFERNGFRFVKRTAVPTEYQIQLIEKPLQPEKLFNVVKTSNRGARVEISNQIIPENIKAFSGLREGQTKLFDTFLSFKKQGGNLKTFEINTKTIRGDTIITNRRMVSISDKELLILLSQEKNSNTLSLLRTKTDFVGKELLFNELSLKPKKVVGVAWYMKNKPSFTQTSIFDDFSPKKVDKIKVLSKPVYEKGKFVGVRNPLRIDYKNSWVKSVKNGWGEKIGITSENKYYLNTGLKPDLNIYDKSYKRGNLYDIKNLKNKVRFYEGKGGLVSDVVGGMKTDIFYRNDFWDFFKDFREDKDFREEIGKSKLETPKGNLDWNWKPKGLYEGIKPTLAPDFRFKTSNIPVIGVDTSVFQGTKITPVVTTRSLQLQDVAFEPIQITSSITRLKIPTKTVGFDFITDVSALKIPTTEPHKTPETNVPGLPSFTLPFGGGGGFSFPKPARATRFKKRYAPSVEAVVFNIRGKGKKSAFSTGLELRPLNF